MPTSLSRRVTLFALFAWPAAAADAPLAPEADPVKPSRCERRKREQLRAVMDYAPEQPHPARPAATNEPCQTVVP
jgi:hypothetical protein